ncbi:gamma-glutamylaminecyclotransferase [Myotis myotis]|uniref:Gamma-glutamylaminecyclotransferase n=1 Tax=Myotis myotis TaxID=51298 RepID=A0A7J7Z2W8_MYOMY|nr:gamma-glutamylaminecyclotransferase [Myotis myotis]XP_036153047.1 gamma-glutamylaminecyclotransferase [Myotis myotis]KAF6368531.1 hypothetical protein mMyoMyo1_005612 [Myotis myotis]
MADVFVYGTLKRGQPNHKVLLDATNGCATFRGRGRGRMVEPYPLVIAGEPNIPRLLNLPGRGYRVFGEIYAVDEQMLRVLDEFEAPLPSTGKQIKAQGRLPSQGTHRALRIRSPRRDLHALNAEA